MAEEEILYVDGENMDKCSTVGDMTEVLSQVNIGCKDRKDDEDFSPPTSAENTKEEDMSASSGPDANGLCSGCDGTVLSDGISAMGRQYHKKCFQCETCKDVLEETFYAVDGQPQCLNCCKVEAQYCGVCNNNVEGDSLVSNGKFYHQDCMKCSVCDDKLKGKYFSYLDQLICEKDYKETHVTCSDCGDIISGAYYTVNTDKVVCYKDYKARLCNCARCGLVVEGKILKVSGAVYHPDCFTCLVCKDSLVDTQFYIGDTQDIYCGDHFARLTAAMCSVCTQPIVPAKGETTVPRLTALGKDYHQECFKCEDCGRVLNSRITGSECYPVNKTPLCLICNKNRQNQ